MTCIPEEVESKMIGKLLLAAAAVFVSAVVCDPLFSRLEYRQSRKNSKNLRIGKNNLYNGLFYVMVSAAFFIPWLIVNRKNDENENLIFSAAFALFGLRLIASYLNKSFEYSLKGFTIKNIFGVKRQYEYNKIIKAYRNSNGMIFHMCDEHKICVSNQFIGIKEFYDLAEKIIEFDNKV